jgi:hypothetical protein
MQEIKDWLQSENKDFNAGLLLFQKYSRNRAILLYLARKKDIEKLEYELMKLAQFDDLKPIEHQSPVSSNFIKKPAVLTEADEVHKLMQSRSVKREDLPEELQVIYDGIADAYKLQRVYHEKMKLATTDEARAELRDKVVECDNIIGFGWDQIDESINLPDGKTPENPDVAKLVGAARTYLSRAIKDFKPENTAKILERVETLIKFKASVKAETRLKLIELHVIEENSNLLGE